MPRLPPEPSVVTSRSSHMMNLLGGGFGIGCSIMLGSRDVPGVAGLLWAIFAFSLSLMIYSIWKLSRSFTVKR